MFSKKIRHSDRYVLETLSWSRHDITSTNSIRGKTRFHHVLYIYTYIFVFPNKPHSSYRFSKYLIVSFPRGRKRRENSAPGRRPVGKALSRTIDLQFKSCHFSFYFIPYYIVSLYNSYHESTQSKLLNWI